MSVWRQFRRRQEFKNAEANKIPLDGRIAIAKKVLKKMGVKNLPQPFMTTKQKAGYYGHLLKLMRDIGKTAKTRKDVAVAQDISKMPIIKRMATAFRASIIKNIN